MPKTSFYRISVKLTPYITVDIPSQDHQLVKDLLMLKDSLESRTKSHHNYVRFIQNGLKKIWYKNGTRNKL